MSILMSSSDEKPIEGKMGVLILANFTTTWDNGSTPLPLQKKFQCRAK